MFVVILNNAKFAQLHSFEKVPTNLIVQSVPNQRPHFYDYQLSLATAVNVTL